MSFADQVRDVLSDTMNLPADFVSFIPQTVAQNPVPTITLIGGLPAPAPTTTATAGQVLTFNGTDYLPTTVGGTEIGYGVHTSNVTTTGTTFGTGIDLLASSIPFTADGIHDYLFTVNAAEWDNSGAAASSNVLRLNFDGADAGYVAVSTVQVISDDAEILSASTPIIAPSAGAHTVNARFTVSAGTGTIKAGAGGAATYRPLILALHILA